MTGCFIDGLTEAVLIRINHLSFNFVFHNIIMSLSLAKLMMSLGFSWVLGQIRLWCLIRLKQLNLLAMGEEVADEYAIKKGDKAQRSRENKYRD